MKLADRVNHLVAILRDSGPCIVVGSSYGGITALCAAVELAHAGAGDVRALLLCAPALARAEPPADRLDLSPPCPVTILHGTRDDIVPIEVSRAYARRHPSVTLIELDDGHTLSGSLDVIVEYVRQLVGNV